MTYDVHVFGQHALDVEELRALLDMDGLRPKPAGDGSGAWTVVRGARARYSFTVGSPVPMEADDVPEKVVAVVLGASCRYEVMVEDRR